MTSSIKTLHRRRGPLALALGVALVSVYWIPSLLYAHPVPNPCYDFVTGGGWFAPTPLGPGRANFGFNAGYRTEGGELKGHLNYIDHNTGLHVSSTSVDAYGGFNCNENGKECADRSFQGSAKVNGNDGYYYLVEVIDTGEPGNAPKGRDRFRIVVSGPDLGYTADSGGAFSCSGDACGIDGGNIQIHKPCNGVNPQ